MKKDITGQKFGKLTAIEETNERKHGCIVWKCQCDCGNVCYVRSDMLRSKEITSCGCNHIKQAKQQAYNMYQKNQILNTNIGRITSDNRQKNNTSGHKGVTWHKKTKKWQARIFLQKKSYHLGYYDDIKEAAEVYNKAKSKLHGEFLKWYEEEVKEKE